MTLREYGPPVSVPLGAEAGRALAGTGVLQSANPDPGRAGHWILRAGSRVGAVRVPGGGPVVRIMPKTPVSRLFGFVHFSRQRLSAVLGSSCGSWVPRMFTRSSS
ncbi:hypothetical protein ACH4FD_02330, partial [Streptomyces sp. NPDC017861]